MFLHICKAHLFVWIAFVHIHNLEDIFDRYSHIHIYLFIFVSHAH